MRGSERRDGEKGRRENKVTTKRVKERKQEEKGEARPDERDTDGE